MYLYMYRNTRARVCVCAYDAYRDVKIDVAKPISFARVICVQYKPYYRPINSAGTAPDMCPRTRNNWII